METVADQVFSWKCITLRDIPEAIYWVVEDPTGHFEKISVTLSEIIKILICEVIDRKVAC